PSSVGRGAKNELTNNNDWPVINATFVLKCAVGFRGAIVRHPRKTFLVPALPQNVWWADAHAGGVPFPPKGFGGRNRVFTWLFITTGLNSVANGVARCLGAIFVAQNHPACSITWKEGESRIVMGNAPKNISTMKNIGINLFRTHDHTSMAQATRLLANDIDALIFMIP
ncbi:MAG: hypothetical protein QM642_08660, partial [Edaphocola sp.]